MQKSRGEGPVVVVGGGPGGLATAKALLDEGLEPLMLEASDAIGGQWNTTAPHSGVWPGMVTNTSKATTVFSDLAHSEEAPLFPPATEIGEYLRRYSERFGLGDCIRTRARVEQVERHDAGGFRVEYRDGEGLHAVEASAVVIASGRCNKPRMPEQIEGLDAFSGSGGLMHAFDYPGPQPFTGQRVLVLGNSVSGLEIASELASDSSIEVFSACRKPRYIIKKLHDDVPSDWRFFNRAAVFIGRTLSPEAAAQGLRDQVLALHGNPADYGAPRPSENLMEAGLAQCQHYLEHCAAGRIKACGSPAKIAGREVTFADGSTESFDTIIAGTGYGLSLPYLSKELRLALGVDAQNLDLYNYTFNPNVEGMAFVGQFMLIGPYFPVLELQARWIAMVWAGHRPLAGRSEMEEGVKQYRQMRRLGAPLVYHEVAMDLAMAAGVEPGVESFPELAAGLVFGPIVPAQFRLVGHGRRSDGRDRVEAALAAVGQTATPPVHDEQIAILNMLSNQPNCWPAVAPALRALVPER